MNRSVKNKKNNKKDILPILCCVFVVVLVAMIVALCVTKKSKKGEFVPPAFEAAAVQGVPEVADGFGYSELYQEGMAYRVSVCGIPLIDKKDLTVYFTNTESNEKYLKLRVLDQDGNILGETGLLKPGEYVKNVELKKAISAGTKIRLKVMGYEPETYESAGAVSLTVTVGGKNK